MCRLLAVRDAHPFAVADLLRPFATIARRSHEYQGDGWGLAAWDGTAWQVHRSIRPIWEDCLDGFGTTAVLVAHARSAFRNEGVAVENNMPFVEAGLAFAFNGELRGVRINEVGRIGAEKLMRFLLRAGGTQGLAGLQRAVDLVVRRTRYVRAMNFVLGSATGFRVCSRFNEAPDYFTLHLRRDDARLLVCSEPFPGEPGWVALPNGLLEEF